MSGTAFNGSPWLTAAEIGGLIVFSFGGAAVGAMLMRRGLARKWEAEFEAAQLEFAKDLKKPTKRRRYAATAEMSAQDELPAEALNTPTVVEDIRDQGT